MSLFTARQDLPGREITPNTGANATKFGDQILKISRQIGDLNVSSQPYREI